ncbi:hypothetical protein Cgig2_004037 [Carnegiea gigantea]|uniref:Uncharacterized protein n=1 Tax=Carnegiea gigantea TaxID=171969 RepID=A0A9Q1KUQ6_9CARY|nr:hypothetical protein Cgig2_004037 [Carnegiea gigantea]
MKCSPKSNCCGFKNHVRMLFGMETVIHDITILVPSYEEGLIVLSPFRTPMGIGYGKSKTAFLTKLGFRLVIEKEKLWSRVLRAKYCQSRCDLQMFKPRSDVSNSWRDILGNIKFLGRRSKIELGNGKQTLFWYDNWLGKEPLYNVATDPVPQTVAECKVADMWDDNRGWKWEVFVD